MKKVLVLIDNIQEAPNSIDFAIQQCKQEQATIVLAYITPPVVNLMLEGEKPLVTNLEKRTFTQRMEQEQLTQWEGVVKTKGFNVTSIEIDGTRIKNLIKVVKEEDFDLIVMNSGGRSWLEDKVRGSHWGTLINQLKTALFIIPTSNKSIIVPV